jgi:hypothetical protein
MTCGDGQTSRGFALAAKAAPQSWNPPVLTEGMGDDQLAATTLGLKDVDRGRTGRCLS